MTIKNAIDKTVSLYSRSGWKSIFAKFRFLYAPFFDVEKLLPEKGQIVDLGCGEGIFANFVGLCSPQRNVLGIEIDEKRLRLAEKGIENVSFKAGNIVDIQVPKADAIVFIQVLHHLLYEEQEKVLRKSAESLKRGGKFIINEIFVELSIRYFLTWIADHLLVAWFFEKRLYSPIYFRRVSDWQNLLEKSGLECITLYPKEQLKLFSNVIFECQKI